ncbi:hypothetical protein B7494_g6663 [Chlorociboria aeruginascens]|nr:hypothetical protein B7494_g6663 [Chlorociboria aeruginascens]
MKRSRVNVPSKHRNPGQPSFNQGTLGNSPLKTSPSKASISVSVPPKGGSLGEHSLECCQSDQSINVKIQESLGIPLPVQQWLYARHIDFCFIVGRSSQSFRASTDEEGKPISAISKDIFESIKDMLGLEGVEMDFVHLHDWDVHLSIPSLGHKRMKSMGSQMHRQVLDFVKMFEKPGIGQTVLLVIRGVEGLTDIHKNWVEFTQIMDHLRVLVLVVESATCELQNSLWIASGKFQYLFMRLSDILKSSLCRNSSPEAELFSRLIQASKMNRKHVPVAPYKPLTKPCPIPACPVDLVYIKTPFEHVDIHMKKAGVWEAYREECANWKNAPLRYDPTKQGYPFTCNDENCPKNRRFLKSQVGLDMHLRWYHWPDSLWRARLVEAAPHLFDDENFGTCHIDALPPKI